MVRSPTEGAALGHDRRKAAAGPIAQSARFGCATRPDGPGLAAVRV